MNTLQSLIEAIKSCPQELTPIVIFDLDDTLIDCRYRKKRILDQFAKNFANDKILGKIAEQLAAIPIHQIRYKMKDTLVDLKPSDEELITISKYWADRHFSNEWIIDDTPFEGAVHYVQQVFDSGAHIVYLTAREERNMGEGTRTCLKKTGFPLGPSTSVLLKEDYQITDLQFKQKAIEDIRSKGQVVGFMENETANLNAMSDVFPEALALFRDTLCSPNPPKLTPKAITVLNFD